MGTHSVHVDNKYMPEGSAVQCFVTPEVKTVWQDHIAVEVFSCPSVLLPEQNRNGVMLSW